MEQYDDIIRLPHHQSVKRAQMPRADRAAQFAPFAALNGYEAAIAETGRLTDSAAELLDGYADAIDEALREIRRRLNEQPAVTITYFEPDLRKDGGAYVTVTAPVKKIDAYTQTITLTTGETIPLSQIITITTKTIK
jgi:hypothetical protein